MSLRNLAVTTVLRLLRVTLTVLSRVVPQSRSVVVSAYPETEGNALEVARALAASGTTARVVWLRESGTAPAEVLALGGRAASEASGQSRPRAATLTLVPKASLRGLWAYLRAEAVFFTHGLYGSPRPTARKPIVNLWHGDGPKDVRPENGVGGLISSTWFVGSTRPLLRLPGRRVRRTRRPRAAHRQPAHRPALASGRHRTARPPRHHRRLRRVDADLPPHQAPSGRCASSPSSATGRDDGRERGTGPARGTARARSPAGDQAAPDGRRGAALGRRRHDHRRRPRRGGREPVRRPRRRPRPGHRLLQRLGRLPAPRPADGLPGARPRHLHPAAAPGRRPRLGAGRAGRTPTSPSRSSWATWMRTEPRAQHSVLRSPPRSA